MRPHYSHSSGENATPSSETRPLASCKGVPPWGRRVTYRHGRRLSIYQCSTITQTILFTSDLDEVNSLRFRKYYQLCLLVNFWVNKVLIVKGLNPGVISKVG